MILAAKMVRHGATDFMVFTLTDGRISESEEQHKVLSVLGGLHQKASDERILLRM